MTPFSIIIDGTVGPVAPTSRFIACSVGARILLLDPLSLRGLGEIELPPQANVLKLVAVGDHLFALLRQGELVHRWIEYDEGWEPVLGKPILDITGGDERLFVLQRKSIIELDVNSPQTILGTWRVPARANSLRETGRYLVAFGPEALWICQHNVDGANWTVETIPHPVAVAALDDTLLVADHLAGLFRLCIGNRIALNGVVAELLHPRAVSFDGGNWVAVAEDGLAGEGHTPDVGPDTVLDLLSTDHGMLVVQSRRISLVQNGSIKAAVELPGYAFHTVCRGNFIAIATESGLFLSTQGEVTHLQLPDPPVALALVENWLLAASSCCLYTIDISRPGQPEVKYTIPRCGEPVALATDSRTLRAVWSCGRAISILDFNQAAGPVEIAKCILGVYPRALALSSSLILAATGPGGFLIGKTLSRLEPVADTGYSTDVATNGSLVAVATIKSLVVYANNDVSHFLTEHFDIHACDVMHNRILVVADSDILSCHVSSSAFKLNSVTRLPFAPRRVCSCSDGALISGIGGVIRVRV